MLRFNGHRVLVFAASCLLGLAASTAMADGYGRGGLYGGRYGGRVGGIGYGSHLYGGGYPIGRSQLGYGGYGYGFARGGFARGGVSISIGGGYPYGFGGYGYRGLGYPFYPGFGSAYLPYRSYVPYAYPGYLSTRPDYAPNALYRPRYDRAPPRNYIYPDGQRYSAAKPAVPSNSDLKPGMILPDGSRVISVGPLDAPADKPAPANEPAPVDPIEPEASNGKGSEREASGGKADVPADPEPVEELPAIINDETSTSL